MHGKAAPRFRLHLRRYRLPRLALYALALLIGIAGTVQGQNEGNAGRVYQVNIDGAINPGTADLLRYAIHTAEANHAAALVVRINTPGGLISSTRDMVTAIADSQVPVIGYVGPAGASATSAGAFILLASHVAAMNTGTNIGASSPVAGDGSDIEGTMGKKVMNDTKAFMRGIASDRGRNTDMAERFVTEAASLTAAEAKAANVIDVTVEDISQLLGAVDRREFQFHGEATRLELNNRQIQIIEPRLVDRLLQVIAEPQIAHMLLTLGFLAIFIEILSPGVAVAGVFGVIAVVLGLIGVQALPLSIGFLALLVMGIVLMIAEFFVTGFGVLGIGGAVAFVLGSINLFDAPLEPDDRNTILWFSIGVSAAILASILLIARGLLAGGKKTLKSVVGETGEAMVSFDTLGDVLVNGRRWPAETTEPLHYGDPIVVVARDERGRLTVSKKPD